mgnify:CR=1 FL=1
MKATTLQEEGTNSSLRGSVKLLTLGLAGHIRYSSGVLKASYFLEYYSRSRSGTASYTRDAFLNH